MPEKMTIKEVTETLYDEADNCRHNPRRQFILRFAARCVEWGTVRNQLDEMWEEFLDSQRS